MWKNNEQFNHAQIVTEHTINAINVNLCSIVMAVSGLSDWVCFILHCLQILLVIKVNSPVNHIILRCVCERYSCDWSYLSVFSFFQHILILFQYYCEYSYNFWSFPNTFLGHRSASNSDKNCKIYIWIFECLYYYLAQRQNGSCPLLSLKMSAFRSVQGRGLFTLMTNIFTYNHEYKASRLTEKKIR